MAQLIGAYVLATPVIRTDDTPIKVLAPGNGKTRIGRIWIYLVDERPWQGTRAPITGTAQTTKASDGVIQGDAFSGYEALTRQVGPRWCKPTAHHVSPLRATAIIRKL